MQIFEKSGRQIVVDSNKSIASGGEGVIYEHPLDKSKVIKIYHSPKSTMLEASLSQLNKLPDEFIKPEIIYYDKSGKIVGFSMRYVDLNSHFLLKKLFSNTYCIQNKIDKSFKYKIYQNLKVAVEKAHSLGIVIGDLNPYNILISKHGGVVMLDVDSYGTSSKPHSGVLLEDIRDWLQHPKIDMTTDQYAFDVLTFWLFTLVHPFRGDYPVHKSLEERVCKKSSVLSGLNIVIPKCYQPFTNPTIIEQFKEVFQSGKRFFVDFAGQPVISTSTPALATIDSTNLHIRKIDGGVDSVVCSDNLLAFFKSGVWYILNVSSRGVYSTIATISDCDNVYLGNREFVYRKSDKLWHRGSELTNIVGGQSFLFPSVGTMFSHQHDYCTVLSVDNIMSNQILMSRSPIYSKSLVAVDGIFQTIGLHKWMLIFSGNSFNLVKTDYNLKNFYRRGDYVLMEHVDKNTVKYVFGKINGLKLEIGCEVSEFKYFDVKDGFIFVPENGRIDMINPVNNWRIVSSIECPVCSQDSRLYHTGAGLIVHTNDEVFLINKK